MILSSPPPRFLEGWDHLNKGAPRWLSTYRERALEAFTSKGLPSSRDEDWKYLSMGEWAKIPFERPQPESHSIPQEDLSELVGGQKNVILLVMINGYYQPELSRLKDVPKGVVIKSLIQALESQGNQLEKSLGALSPMTTNPFLALNAAWLREGVTIHIPRGVLVETPIHLLYISQTNGTPTVAHTRNIVVAEESAQLTLIENFSGHGATPYWTNTVTEIHLGEAASLDHYKLQRENNGAFHTGVLNVSQGKLSHFKSHSISLGARLSRFDLNTELTAEGSECLLQGLFLAGGEQQVDHHIRIDHLKPHGTSQTFYKGILDGRARGVFDGRVVVHPDAQKTNASQVNKNLLLSETAEVDPKPQLEILANDVKCSHGSTVGQLDEDALFYLRSRGIGESEARRLMIYAFADEVVEKIPCPSVRYHVECLLTTALSRGHYGGTAS